MMRNYEKRGILFDLTKITPQFIVYKIIIKILENIKNNYHILFYA